MTTKKRPDVVQIGAFEYEFVYDDKLGSIGYSGVTNNDSLFLGIDHSLADDVVRETMVHEILHAIWSQTGLNIDYPDGDKDSVGEKVIRALSPYVFMVLKQNPEVVRWLTK